MTELHYYNCLWGVDLLDLGGTTEMWLRSVGVTTLERDSTLPSARIQLTQISSTVIADQYPRLMSEGGRIQCPHCDKTVSNDLYLKQHITFKHSSNASEESENGPRPSTYKHRYLAVEDYQELRAAVRTGENLILCPYCNHVPFKAKQFLFQHVTLIHSSEPRPKRRRKGVDLIEVSNDAEQEILEFANDLSPSSPFQVVRLNPKVSTFNREDNRKSYSNGFKASIIEEIEKGTSRKALSEAYDIPMRTLEKWMKRDHDIILSCRGNVELSGYSRIVRKTLDEKIHEGEHGYLEPLDVGQKGKRKKTGGRVKRIVSEVKVKKPLGRPKKIVW